MPDDTARMNAALNIEHQWWEKFVCTMVGETLIEEPHDGTTEGKLKAWMRASTRAAAEIGRGV